MQILLNQLIQIHNSNLKRLLLDECPASIVAYEKPKDYAQRSFDSSGVAQQDIQWPEPVGKTRQNGFVSLGDGQVD